MDNEKKTDGQLLEEKLLLKKENGFKTFAQGKKQAPYEFCAEYMSFIDRSKTEREFTKNAVALLEKAGFKPLEEGKKYKAGDKVYSNNHGKSVLAAVVGKKPVEDGVNIVAAHIDNPRLDLKPNPLYEESELGYFKTHYYGGIKKYQWVTIPLALHGVVAKNDGSVVEITIGEEAGEPAFVVTDLLPHLSAKAQDDRKSREVIKGEELNILIGSEPLLDDKVKEPVKLNIMRILNEKYGITEADFRSAELEAVPAFRARDLGFDGSLIGAYGHDDRSCSYVSLRSFIDMKETPERTAVCVLADKEETGSEGNTGLASDMLSYFISRLSSDHMRALHNSKCLSCDVNAAFDPTFGEVH